MLQIETLSLTNIIEKGRVHDSVEAQARTLEEIRNRDHANALNGVPQPQKYMEKTKTSFSISDTKPQVGKRRQSKNDNSRCAYSGGQYHHRDFCPAYNKTCLSCDKFRHFA